MISKADPSYFSGTSSSTYALVLWYFECTNFTLSSRKVLGFGLIFLAYFTALIDKQSCDERELQPIIPCGESMSFSGSGISFSGLASGVDTDSIIQQILRLQSIPIQRLNIQQQILKGRQASLDQYRSLLSAIRGAASDLSNSRSFTPIKSTSSDTSVATAIASESALPGTYLVSITKLAQAHKIGSSGQQDSSTALSLSGSFLLNGKSINIAPTDSLSSIAGKINSVGAGVTASIINGGMGAVYLTLTANTTGTNSSIGLTDLNGANILESLGFVQGSINIRKPITNGAEGIGYSNSTVTIQSMTGVTIPSGNITINGINIELDFSSDSLLSIRDKINASGAQVTASVDAKTVNGVTKYFLKIVGNNTPTFSDSNNMLQALGILQRTLGNELLSSQDAVYSLDGISMTSESNTISGVIPGVTLQLLSADTQNPKTTTITLTRDSEGIRQKIDRLANAYNDVIDFVKKSQSFDKDTFATGPLFGDSTVSLVQSMLFSGLLTKSIISPETFPNLLAIGIDFSSDGKMTVDASKIEAAIASNLDAVRGLFAESGTIDDVDISFVSSTSKTKSSGPEGYEIIITQLATKGTFTTSTSFSGPSTETETLTFDGMLLGNTPYSITINPNSTIDSLVEQINNDNKLKNLIVASKTIDNKLILTSRLYGTPGNFSVVSDLEAGSDNSGIGSETVIVSGLDVAGTINGEEATGSGQLLTGNAGNTTTDGLQIRVTGGSTGSRGFLLFSKGAATTIMQSLDAALDISGGLVTEGTRTLQQQIDDIDTRITSLTEALTRQQEVLRQRFRVMEQAVARLQAQTARLSSILAGLQQYSNSNR